MGRMGRFKDSLINMIATGCLEDSFCNGALSTTVLVQRDVLKTRGCDVAVGVRETVLVQNDSFPVRTRC